MKYILIQCTSSGHPRSLLRSSVAPNLSISAEKPRKRRLRPPVPVGGLNESNSGNLGENPLPKSGLGRRELPGFFRFFFLFLMVKKGDGLEKMFENGWGNQSTPATTCYVAGTFERLILFHFVLV